MSRDENCKEGIEEVLSMSKVDTSSDQIELKYCRIKSHAVDFSFLYFRCNIRPLITRLFTRHTWAYHLMFLDLEGSDSVGGGGRMKKIVTSGSTYLHDKRATKDGYHHSIL